MWHLTWYLLNFSYFVTLKSISQSHTLIGSFIYDSVTSCTGSFENTGGFLDYADPPNVHRIHYTITKNCIY